jgi:hypothetical protein
MTVHTELTPAEAADRLALRELLKLDGSWYFAERKLILDWSETRSMTDH